MSVQALSWVLDHSQSRLADRLVLIAIANHFNHKQDCAWPAIETLAGEAHVSARQVKRSIKNLAAMGELKIGRGEGPHGTHSYHLPGVTICHPSKSEGVTNPVKRGDKLGNSLTQFVTQSIIEPLEPLTYVEHRNGTRVPSRHIDRVFQHWKQEFNHPRSVCSEKRRRLISARLKEFSLEDLEHAISGYKLSPHHMGTNLTGTVYDSIELMLRDIDHVERGLQFFANPPGSSAGAPMGKFDRMMADQEHAHG